MKGDQFRKAQAEGRPFVNIRVDEQVMAALLELRGQIERRTNRPASMNDAVHELIRRHQEHHE